MRFIRFKVAFILAGMCLMLLCAIRCKESDKTEFVIYYDESHEHWSLLFIHNDALIQEIRTGVFYDMEEYQVIYFLSGMAIDSILEVITVFNKPILYQDKQVIKTDSGLTRFSEEVSIEPFVRGTGFLDFTDTTSTQITFLDEQLRMIVSQDSTDYRAFISGFK